MEVDFYRRLPARATLHVARMYLEETTVEGESRMLDEFLPRAVDDLRSLRPDAVVFGCTSAGALRGNDYENSLMASISKTCGCPVISVISAVRHRLQKMGARTAVVITPYVEELNERVRRSVEANGVRVLDIRGLGIDVNFEIAAVEPPRIVELAVSAVRVCRPDVIFLSCTNFRGLDAGEEVSRLTGLPVMTSNGVALESALEALGM
jgi:maleate isomerase